MHMRDIMELAPVIPVISIEDPDTAVPLARALVAGGLPVLEITLRTPRAFEAIARIVAEVPEAVVGVGTIQRPDDLHRSAALGVRFAVSPGLTRELVETARTLGLPFLPGVMTPSDILLARELGLHELKLFPAELAGGLDMLKALAGPFPDIRFCPTGGIRPDTLADFLARDNVLCVGGTWLAPRGAVETGDWAQVTQLAREAVAAAGTRDAASLS